MCIVLSLNHIANVNGKQQTDKILANITLTTNNTEQNEIRQMSIKSGENIKQTPNPNQYRIQNQNLLQKYAYVL